MQNKENLDNNASKTFKQIPEKKPKVDKEEKRSKKNALIKAHKFLAARFDFRYNVFIQKPEYKLKKSDEYEVFDERGYNNILMELKMDEGLNITDNDFRTLIGSEKLSAEYDPVKEYLFNLPKWDGKDRFPEFLRCVQLKDELINRERFIAYFKKWFVAYVGALVERDRYNENCLVLVGGQGVGKTRFLISLVPKDLRLQYTFVGDYNFEDKDHKEMLGTKLIINLDEMSSLTRTDIAKLKTTMSLQQVEVRRAYGRQSIIYYRKASFCGSINEDQFLTDQTGNRRWLPFYVEGIDLNYDFDVSLLYSQALAELKKGFLTWFEKHEIEDLENYSDQFRRRPIEEELLLANFEKPNRHHFEDNRVEWYQTSEINAYLTSDEAYKKMNMNETTVKKLGMALKSLNFPRQSKVLEDRSYPIYCWGVVKITDKSSDKIRRDNIFNEREPNEGRWPDII